MTFGYARSDKYRSPNQVDFCSDMPDARRALARDMPDAHGHAPRAVRRSDSPIVTSN